MAMPTHFRQPETMYTLFIADLHLSDHTADLTELFVQFLHDHAAKAAALYILGDLFEAWTGDDDPSHTAGQVADAIRVFSQHAPVYFIAGNRDFLLGHAYAARAKMIRLPEQYMIELHGKRILLSHGDEMCTDDVSYQRYRAMIRNRCLIKMLLALPFQVRQKIAQNLRYNSHQRKQQASTYQLSDVTEQGVRAALCGHRALDVMIHGHTHRENTHIHQIDGKQITRYVLPDWKNGQGGYLAADATGFQFFRLPESDAASIDMIF